MNLSDCCKSVAGLLPDAELPFLPSLLLGLLVSASVLVWLVRKQTQQPLAVVLADFLRQLFSVLPSPPAEDTSSLGHRSVWSSAVKRWRITSRGKYSQRLARSMEAFVSKASERTEGDDTSSLVFFLEDLPSHPWWNQYEVYKQHTHLLAIESQVKLEFSKALYQLQKGVCKAWRKAPLAHGHSCVFPLIEKGVINTENCQRCPETFRVRGECLESVNW